MSFFLKLLFLILGSIFPLCYILFLYSVILPSSSLLSTLVLSYLAIIFISLKEIFFIPLTLISFTQQIKSIHIIQSLSSSSPFYPSFSLFFSIFVLSLFLSTLFISLSISSLYQLDSFILWPLLILSLSSSSSYDMTFIIFYLQITYST